MSDMDVNIPEDDITILHDLQLHDEDGNPYPLGSPPQFQFFSEGGGTPTGSVGASAEDTAGSNAALKTAYDHVRNQNVQLRKYSDQLKKQYIVVSDKNKQMKMLAQATPVISFHTAAASGNVDQIHELLESGIEVNGRNSEGKTALHTGAASSQSNVCSLLLHAKADPNAADIDGKAPIHLACRNGDMENCRLLLEFGADVNAMDRDGRTPLHVAATNGHPELCKLLLEAGKEADIDVNQTDLYGQTPMSMAKLNCHQDVFTVLQQAGGSLPPELENKQPTDKSDSTSVNAPTTQQISLLNRMIQSLLRLLTILVTKVEVTAKFPDIKEKIDQLRMTSENPAICYDENKLKSLELTIEDVCEMGEWVNQEPNLQGQSASGGQTEHATDLKRQLSEVRLEIVKVKSELEQERKKKENYKEQVTLQESEISRLRTDAENVDLYSATNLEEEEEGEPYDIGKLFSKVALLENSSKDLRNIVQNAYQKKKGNPQPKQLQRTRQASSLPTPHRNQTAGMPRQSSSLNENGTTRQNFLQDIRFPPSDNDQPPQVVVTNLPRSQQTGFQPYQGPGRQGVVVGQQGHDSWEHLSTGSSADTRRLSQNDSARIQESGTARQNPARAPGSGFVPRSPSHGPNQPFDSVRGPPGFEYSNNTQSPTRIVEGASQVYIYEDGLPASPRRNSDQRFTTNAKPPCTAQNNYSVSCSDERQGIGSRDQIVVPSGGRLPQENTWNQQVFPQRDEIATGLEQVNQTRYNEGALNNQQQQFPREPPAAKQMECPVCQRTFAPNTPEENMTAHVNRHFDGTSGGGTVDGFEVFPST